ncbi:hypothetical protein KTT_27730 [Tengunoibacter tsumagoiensis]|uniref:Rhamnogalacturonase A/B/Epimerase-like pectate lyase domain-containing protein n=1 Tax=Tengunoibacter tsumagoiensis TaxID=2014871 RepID=A0A402A1C5_9CHLR|nr:hypothetical protein KTT_27730 [Tengunoibacter tsumagoiensis]
MPEPKPLFVVDPQGKKVFLDAHKNSMYLNVQDYGAVGDGRADDTGPIQNAINQAAGGATIFFPPGVYLISRTIALKNGLSYLGSNSTIKQAKNSNLLALAAVQEYLQNETFASPPVHMTNLCFDGNSAHNTHPPRHGGHGLVLMSSYSTIEGCWFTNIPQTAIVFSDRNSVGKILRNSSIENTVVRCKIETTGQYGIWVRDEDSGRCTDGYIRDCVVNGTADTAIFVERGAGWFLSGNHVYGCQLSGIIVDNAWSTSIIGNEVDGYGYNMSASVGYCAGLSVTCIGPRATIVQGNVVSTPEMNPHTMYQHLVITGGGSTDTRCVVVGNAILGGYVPRGSNGAQQSKQAEHSAGIVVQSNATQISSKQQFYALVALNRVDGVGQTYFNDAAPTTIMASNEMCGDLRTDGDFHTGNHFVTNGQQASISNGSANGKHAPYPTIHGNDVRGIVSFGCGDRASQGEQVQIQFANPYKSSPVVVISAANAAAAQTGTIWYVSSITNHGFSIASSTSPSPHAQDNTTYSFTYQVMG